MKNLFIKFLFFCLITFTLAFLAATGFAQTKPATKPAAKSTPKPAVRSTPAPVLTEEQEFDKAKNTKSAAGRTKSLQAFLAKYPETALKTRVLELIVSARAQEADEKIRAGDADGGVALFELAVQEAPEPYGEEFFDQVLSLIPENLFALNQPGAAVKISGTLETKAGNNIDQLLSLAKVHLGVENFSEAKRLSKKIIDLDASRAEVYDILGSASVTDLQLSEAADAYEKALQLNNTSLLIKLNLANIKRGQGKAAEALALYRQITEKDPKNTQARTGLVLSLFDAGKRAEAETLLQEAMAANPKNYNLLTGAAYWYAAHNDGQKAIEYAQKSIEIEPRYVWSYIALARGMTLQKLPAEAERAILEATRYGNFATLSYELASSKAGIGLYEEAAADLRHSFTLKDGKLEVKLAGRVPQTADSFTELLALERRASIYQSTAADSAENAKLLKQLFIFDSKLNEKDAKEEDLVAAADIFTAGNDKMQIYRRFYAASKLLQKRAAPSKVLELSQAAIPGIDSAVEIPGAATAVLAEELTDARTEAFKKGSSVVVPNIQKPILLNVLRGRVEELSGGALLQQKKNDEALVRLKRAVTVLPEKSSWWRSGQWKLGQALSASGRSEEAFEAYSKSYVDAPPDTFKYAVLQGMCQSLFSTLDGCADKIVAAAKGEPKTKPGSSILKAAPTPTPTPQPAVNTETQKDEIKNDPVSAGEDQPSVEEKPAPTPAQVEQKPGQKLETTPTPVMAPVMTPVSNDGAKIEPLAAVLKETKTAEAPETTVEEAKTGGENPSADTKDGETRKRTVASKTGDGKTGVVYSNPNAQVTVNANAGCELLISDKKISVINNGGWSSLTIDRKGEGDLDAIKVTAENPEDVALEFQKGIGRDIGRVVYVVRSISTKKGEFKLFVESPCGEKRELLITVR